MAESIKITYLEDDHVDTIFFFENLDKPFGNNIAIGSHRECSHYVVVSKRGVSCPCGGIFIPLPENFTVDMTSLVDFIPYLQKYAEDRANRIAWYKSLPTIIKEMEEAIEKRINQLDNRTDSLVKAG